MTKHKGWFKNSEKHSLAARGIPTGKWGEQGEQQMKYKEQNLFDLYHKQLPRLEQELNIGETIEVEDRVSITGQEVYLGYIPKDDEFVAGWDIWEHSEQKGQDTSGWGVVHFKVKENGRIEITNSEIDIEGHGMYDTHGGHTLLKNWHKDLVDIRLD